MLKHILTSASIALCYTTLSAAELSTVITRTTVAEATMAEFDSATTGLISTITASPTHHMELFEIKANATWATDDKNQAKAKIEITQDGKPVKILGKPNSFGYFNSESYMQTLLMNRPQKENSASETISALCLIDNKSQPVVKINGQEVTTQAAKSGKVALPALKAEFKVLSKESISEIATPKGSSRNLLSKSTSMPGSKLNRVKVECKLSKDTDKSIQHIYICPGQFSLITSSGETIRAIGSQSEMGDKEFQNAQYPYNVSRNDNGEWPNNNILTLTLIFPDSKEINGAKLAFTPFIVKK